MLLPLGHEEMSPIQLALEVALHELSTLHGLHVTDVPYVVYTWDIDTSEVTEMLSKVLDGLRPDERKGSVQDDS